MTSSPEGCLNKARGSIKTTSSYQQKVDIIKHSLYSCRLENLIWTRCLLLANISIVTFFHSTFTPRQLHTAVPVLGHNRSLVYLCIFPGSVLFEKVDPLLYEILKLFCMFSMCLGACRLVCVGTLVLRVVQAQVVQHVLCRRQAVRGTAIPSHACNKTGLQPSSEQRRS